MKVLEPIFGIYLVEFKGQSFFHMGSTAITGMYGKPMPDLCIVTKDLLPNFPKNIIDEMSKLGFKYCGPSPHSFNKYTDQWFITEELQKADAICKGFTVHCISEKEARRALQDFLDYKDYLNQSEDARQRYRAVKEKNSNSSLMDYVLAKQSVVLSLRIEAK